MRKIAVIHQPDFLPWLGFFHRLLDAETFVVLDSVQFVNGSRSWTKRDKIKTKNGPRWITVGVTKCHQQTLIKDVFLGETDWRMEIKNAITENYRKAPYYEQIFPYIERLLEYKCEKLVDFNMKSIDMLLELLGIQVETVFASALKASGSKNELLADLLHEIEADTYLSGVGAKDYLKEDVFYKKGIQVIWQEFAHPEYPQQYGEFVPYLSSIDLLLNCGIEESRKIIREV